VSCPKVVLLDTGLAARLASVSAAGAALPANAGAAGQLLEELVAGVVLHTDSTAAPFGPRITAASIDILWAP
jgi:hypothetical protein